ncbi:MAG: 50S ribosomal protein L19 [Candidatus Yanofskybacteria bacterium]|nr:50S ribosomal protein L19 [Candidatus Yanofskybacteria bacterium]
MNLQTFNKNLISKSVPAITAGDTVRVYQKIKEGGKFRTQAFEGIVIARKHGLEPGATITVRKMSGDIGVERIFPLYLPTIEKIEVLKSSRVRRAKLYYIRGKSAKATRRKMKAQELTQTPTVKKSEKETQSSSPKDKLVESK